MKKILFEEIEYVQLEPTTRCNFSCEFCCGRKMPQQNILWETFQSTIDTLPKVKHIQLQGEGEPLLHSRFFDMAKYIKQNGIKLSIITNGSLLKVKDNITQILNIGFEKVSVSIESADEEIFKKIRGGNLKDIILGIRTLIEERNKRKFEKPIIDFAVTVLKSTINSYPAIVSLYQELNMDGGINTQLLQTMETYVLQYDKQMSQEFISEESSVQFQKFRVAGENIIGQPKKIGFYKDLFYNDLVDDSIKFNTCPWLEKGLFINVNGDMTPCCRIKKSEYGYGNIKDSDRQKYYLVRNQMQEQLQKGEVPLACTGCYQAEKYRAI